MKSSYAERVSEYYSELLRKHGDSVASLDWGSTESQRLRFQVLAEVGVWSGQSVLDVGCGRGDFWSYLADHGYQGRYVGIDITPGMVELAKLKFRNTDFRVADILREHIDGVPCDYVVASGVFYLEVGNNQRFFRAMLRRFYGLANIAVAFNMLSSHGPPPEPGEYVFNPGWVLEECLKLSRCVILRHDYKNNDFTVYVFQQ